MFDMETLEKLPPRFVVQLMFLLLLGFSLGYLVGSRDYILSSYLLISSALLLLVLYKR